jgi:hypothetical protein
MAAIQWSWTNRLAAIALLGLAWACPELVAQSGGAITGRLTDLHSAPLDGATVVVRNEATGAEARTTTARNGTYKFIGLDPGEYTLDADSVQLGHGRLEGIFVAAGHQARVQTAMEFELPQPRPLQVATREIPTVNSQVATSLPARPLQQMALTPHRLPQPTPEAVTPALTAVLAAEAPRTLTMAARPLPAPRPSPSPEPPVMTASFLPQPPRALPLSAQALPIQPNLALAQAASNIMQIALQLSLARLNAVRAGYLIATHSETVAATGATVTGAQLQALPVTGRRWQDFVLDSPTTAPMSSSQGSFRLAGQLPVETSVDGANLAMAFGGPRSGGQDSSGSNGRGEAEPAGMAQVWAGGRGAAISETAIREVQMVAGNVEAEDAHGGGGRMDIETERGTNGLHGQGSFSDRQNSWGAQNPFTQWVKETAPGTEITTPTFTPESYTPPDQETAWTIGAGGQIRRDKLFWFAALDGFRRNDPGLATVKHPAEFFAQPSNDQMQVLSARLGLSSINPVAEGVGAYSKMLETLAGLLGPAPRTAAQWVGFSRIDWQAAERHRFTLEGIGARWDSPGGGLGRVSETFGADSFGSSQASQEWLSGRWEAFLTPNLLTVTQGSIGRTIQRARPEAPSPFEQTFLGPNVWGQLPQIVVDSRYGFTIGNPSRFGQGSYPDERMYQAQESVSWVKGVLLAEGGFDVSHNSDATSLLRNQTGTYTYSSLENFASDALAFASFGVSGQLNPANQHNCDQTGKVWRDTSGQLRGLGYLPCYSYYSQVIGPTNWNLSTNDWAGFATAQWQPKKLVVISAGLRWERQQMPPPIAALANPELPLTQQLPSPGNNWGPRLSLALGGFETHWPVLRLGYGMYFGRTENATLETALTQTGSLNGDLKFFMRPTDNLNAGGAPPFPYVLAGQPASIVKPGAVEFAPGFHNPEIHQGVAAIEEELPGHVLLTASAVVSLGRRLPVSIDTNFDPKVNPGTITYGVVDGTELGPIKTAQVTVPFYANWPSANSPTGVSGRLNANYQQISEIMSRANSTYEAAMLKITRNGRRGLSLSAHYTYSHAMDWNPNESTSVAGSDILDPANFNQEYGTSDLDMRHSAAGMLIYEAPWKLRGPIGRLANGWRLSGIAQFRSGLPYTMRTSGSLAEEFNSSTGAAIVALAPGMNGSGGDNRVYGIGRNTYRYPATWKADVRLGKSFNLGHMRQLEVLAESFNLLNHQNVTELETTGYYIESGSLSGALPTLNFLTGLKPNTTAFGQPLNVNATDFFSPRQIQFGLKFRF